MYDQRFYQRIRQHEVISEVIIILYLDGIFLHKVVITLKDIEIMIVIGQHKVISDQ